MVAVNRTRALSALGLVVAVATVATVTVRMLLPSDRVLPGLRVEGFVLPEDIARGSEEQIAAYIEQRVRTAREPLIEVTASAAHRSVPLATVTLAPDARAIARAVRSVMRGTALGGALAGATGWLWIRPVSPATAPAQPFRR